MGLQLLTTAIPDETQLEVAVIAPLVEELVKPLPLLPLLKRLAPGREASARDALLLGALAASHLMAKARLEEELQTRVETARLKDDTAMKLREKVDKLKAQSSFLQKRKQQIVPALTVVNELTELLPDGTWLERLVFKQDQVDLFGLSSKASTLISDIETSPIFEDVAFQAPVVQEERFSSERFQISAHITLPEDYAN